MKSTISKRLVALCMAFAMMFSLMTVVHAEDVSDGLSKPTTHTEVAKPATVTSISVGSATAYYETDDNTGSTTYIRAQLTGKTEYDLKSVTVTVNLENSGTTVALDGIAIDGNTTARTFTTNLLNKAHTLTIDGTDYVLAAGLPSGRVSFSPDDPLSLGTVTMAGTTMDVYGANAQNPCMGNPYYVNRNENWTFINYFITGILPTGLSSVETTYALKSGASISGAGATNVTASTCTFDFTVGNILTVTNGSESRAYDAELAVEGQSVIVKQAEDGTRNYDINLSEVINSTHYSAVEEKVDAIADAWEAYILTPRTFSAGTSVMEILQAFDTWAHDTTDPVSHEKYFTGDSDFGGGTYLSKLNGLNWNDCGNLAGYMYTNDANGYYWTSADNHSTIPPVGAADMVFTSSTRIVWFYTVNYQNWF